jgi:putative membrane protein
LLSRWALEVRVASVVLISCGLACGVLALRRWMINERAIRLGEPLPSSPMLLVVTGVALLAVVLAILA